MMKESSWLSTILRSPHKNKGLEPEYPVIGIISFKAARMMRKVANLWHSLRDRHMSLLKEELSYSHGIRTLISDDYFYLIDRAFEQFIENLSGVAISVARLGKKCMDPVYHNLDFVFDNPFEIDVKWCGWEYRLKKMEKRVKKMKRFTGVICQLHEELGKLADQEMRLTKMQSNGVNKGQLQEFHQKVMWRREEVSVLREMSPWVRSYDYIVRLLLRSLFTLVERMKFTPSRGPSTCHRAPVLCGRYPSIIPQRGTGPPVTGSFNFNCIFQNDLFDPIKKTTSAFNSKLRLVHFKNQHMLVQSEPGMVDLQVGGGIKKLNNQNYNTWSTCMASYLQGQDLWEVVNGNEVRQPEAEDANGVLRKWRIKAGKAMFALKTTVEDAATPKVAWDTFTELFSKKNDTKLQLLESELLSVAQRDLTIAQYLHKVKTLCREISELDPDAPIGDTRMKRIIIHGLKPQFRSYVAAIQGWHEVSKIIK
ncbi:retrovirus-related pol polyprotein from transposon RE1 [Tanacetum coccineum]